MALSESNGAALPSLLDAIAASPDGMPVRLMEHVIGLGAPAVEEIGAALARSAGDEDRDLLWLIVMLGEIGSPAGVAPLIAQLARSDADILAQASAEALAKIGRPAVPALIDLAARGNPEQRLWAYGALGWIDDPRAVEALEDALRRDPELVDIIAGSLAAQGRREAVPLLLEQYRTCEPWQRPELEGAIASLERGPLPSAPWLRDWRLRYRRRPELDFAPDIEWPGVVDILRRRARARPELADAPLRSLSEILSAAATDLPPAVCDECGARVENLNGVLVCPSTAVSTALFQLGVLEDAQEEGVDDLFDLLSDLEGEEGELRGEPVPKSARARARREDELEDLVEARATVEWLIGAGIEDVATGVAALTAARDLVIAQAGDADVPASPAGSRAPKVGRNDPCPCGSGRKYKRCCLGQGNDGA